MILPYLKQSHGDTLVEVTIALAILSAVLASSFGLAGLAFRVGQNSKERTQAANFIQEQAEALHNYRDNQINQHNWANIVALNGTSFSMKNNGTNWTPTGPSNYTPLIDGTPSIFKITDTARLIPPDQMDFTIDVDWQNNGSGPNNHSQVVVRLVNTDGIVPGCATGC